LVVVTPEGVVKASYSFEPITFYQNYLNLERDRYFWYKTFNETQM
jgi:hypothetical protein